MTRKDYEFDILVHGKPIREYYKDNKSYVEGRKGRNFSLRIKNNSWQRILAIPSVDGLSVMNGKEASYNSSGYIIDPKSSITIDGWRTSDKEVAQFYFSDHDNSYAARADKDGNVGVVGLAIFGEKEDWHEKTLRAIEDYQRRNPPIVIEKHCHGHHCGCYKCNPTVWYSSGGSHTITLNSSSAGIGATASSNDSVNAFYSNMSVTPTASINSVQQELGTGWGESKRSEVTTVEFERKSSPEAVFEIFYNTREQLEKLGIDFNSRPVYVAPQAFPNQYCEPPVR